MRIRTAQFLRMSSFRTNFQHLLIPVNANGIQQAAHLIQEGKLLAFPTETVYGLGANALNAEAVKSIFVAKGRPLTDPLIVHVTNATCALELVDIYGEEVKMFNILSQFWPGPLTLIAKASSIIPSLVTAETGFVGVRCPAHPIAMLLLEAAGLPIAAPSANRFGHVSPTRAHHVLADLGEKGVMVLDGECNDDDSSSCQHGIESTVAKIDGINKQILIFRQGAVTHKQIERCIEQAGLPWRVVTVERRVHMTSSNNNNTTATTASEKHQDQSSMATTTTGATAVLEEDSRVGEGTGQQAPGQAITHYAPDVPCMIVSKISRDSTVSEEILATGCCNSPRILSVEQLKSVVIVDFHGQLHQLKDKALAYRDLSVSGNTTEAAHCLFDLLRWSEQVPNATNVLLPHVVQAENIGHGDTDLSLGLADRIFRAASGVIVELQIQPN